MYSFHHHIFQDSAATENWSMCIATGAFVVSIFTLYLHRRQLEKEQEPFVVARDDVSFRENNFKIKLKNVGRGPAFNITGCRTSSEKERNRAFFMNNQPHSKNLCANNADVESEKHWRIDKFVMDSLSENKVNGEIYKYFCFFYESQLGSVYYTKVKIKKNGSNYIVMDNERRKVNLISKFFNFRL